MMKLRMYQVDAFSKSLPRQSYGIPKDSVTGSTHCVLVPYWSKRINKSTLLAKQISKRGGELYCELLGERVAIGGKAVKYFEGDIYL